MIGQGAVGRKKRNARMNERVDCGWGRGSVGVSHNLGKRNGDPSTRLGRRVEGYGVFIWQKGDGGGPRHKFWSMKRMLQSIKLVTLPSLRWRF